MWLFGRKKRNRRSDQGRELDLKPARKKRWSRLRMVALALFVSGLTAGAGYGCWVGAQWAVQEFIYENETFSIRTLDVQTDGEIPLFLIQRWAGVKPGDNLLALDLSRIKRDLELVSLVERASVERVLPSTLKVLVTERKAVARVTQYRWLASSESWRAEVSYLDQYGYVIAPLPAVFRPTGHSEKLPEITGVKGTELRPGHPVNSPPVFRALELVDLFKRSPLVRLVDLVAIDASTPQVLVVTTEKGSEITLAQENLQKQLNRWYLVHRYGMEVGRTIATLDLSIPNHVPARWIEDNHRGSTGERLRLREERNV